MPANKEDRNILRDLACQVAEIAALPLQQQTIARWKALNGLNPVRPMVAIDQIPWHEMDVDAELTLQTTDEFCRGVETRLRRILYCWKHMRADMVVSPALEFGKAIRGLGFGLQTVEERAVIDPNNSVVGHYYIDQLKTEEDVQKIRNPEIALDKEATARIEEEARELLDDIMAVEMQGSLPGFAAWDLIVQWRGAENVLWDLADRPQHMHAIMSRLTEAQLAMLDQLEAENLLGFGQRTIHCTGAHTDELPTAPPQHPPAQDLWTYGMAQIFSSVSPAMHQEFELDYAARWYARFGLIYYGCCEPLHEKIDIIGKIPRVRKISMSPWVDVEQGAECIGGDFVFSRKPNPAFLAGATWERDVVEKDLRHTLEQCTRHGCPVEFILKDISTVRYQPQRLWEWADIAMQVVEG